MILVITPIAGCNSVKDVYLWLLVGRTCGTETHVFIPSGLRGHNFSGSFNAVPRLSRPKCLVERSMDAFVFRLLLTASYRNRWWVVCLVSIWLDVIYPWSIHTVSSSKNLAWNLILGGKCCGAILLSVMIVQSRLLPAENMGFLRVFTHS